MAARPFFVPRPGPCPESFCSRCCKTVRPNEMAPTLAEAEADHMCIVFSARPARLKGRYARIRALIGHDV